MEATNYKAPDLQRLLNLQESLSMDKPLYEGTELTLGDTIAAKEKSQENPSRKEKLYSGILANIHNSKLDYADKNMLVERFGLNGKKPKSVSEIASKYKLTRPGAKQRINDALLKLEKIN